ncbi:AAA family ATPase [Candidatus Woesearchaeota archaeon]|nr:AAA family ATPase [Candidatus Woesearchaeota archaeon]
MKKICIFNLKGGVGKTTTAVNLAAGLARRGKRVLLLDMDAQGSVNNCLSSNDSIKDMYHLMANGAELQECITHMGHNLDAVTSKGSLHTINKDLAEKSNRDFILSMKLKNLNSYEYVIMDCPPQFGTMTRNALFFCDEVFVPVCTDILGYKGLTSTIELIEEMNNEAGNEDDKIKVSRIIPTFYDKRLRISKKILNMIEDEFYGMVSNPIRANSKIKEAPEKKKSIFSYAKSSSGAQDYSRLIDYVLHSESFPEEEECSHSEYDEAVLSTT